MNWFLEFYSHFLDRMDRPYGYGLFHIFMIILLTTIVAFLVLSLKNTTEKQNKWVLLTYSLIFFFIETNKLIIMSLASSSIENFKFDWHIFPFQLCSTPMYIAFIAAFLKEGKLRNVLYSFLATYGMFAGMMVVVYPDTVFTSLVFTNFQTMIHHFGQIFIGAYLVCAKKVDWNYKTILRSIAPFVILVAIAVTLNIVIYNTILPEGQSFAMFNMSPYFSSELPVIGEIQKLFMNTGNWFYYILFVLSYIVSFTALCFVFMYAIKGITYLFNLISKKSNTKTA
jgi:hypothetical protein